MRLYPFLCLNGQEITFADRTQTYVRSGLAGPNWSAGSQYDCDILRDGETFLDPATDDAPWYDPNIPYSTDFLGVSPTRMDLITSYRREVEDNGRGGTVSSLKYRPYILQFTGWMIAKSELGMMYGDAWLREVLRGSQCDDGFSRDEALILPACPTEEDPDETHYLRYLLNVGVIDPPAFTAQEGTAECELSLVTFQLAAAIPYRFSPAIPVVDDDPISASYEAPTCALISTNDWPGDAVANITITAETDVYGIHLEGNPTFDEECPSRGAPPCWSVEIPYLPMDGVIKIDSRREEILYTDPALKSARSGLRMVRYTPPISYPEISPCSDFCVCAWAESGTASITIDKHIREV